MPKRSSCQKPEKVRPANGTPSISVKKTVEASIVAEPERRGPGRPPGAENLEYDIVEAAQTKCQRCGSTERARYKKEPAVLRQHFEDKTVIITWRKTRCLKCGRARKDKYTQEDASSDM